MWVEADVGLSFDQVLGEGEGAGQGLKWPLHHQLFREEAVGFVSRIALCTSSLAPGLLLQMVCWALEQLSLVSKRGLQLSVDPATCPSP